MKNVIFIYYIKKFLEKIHLKKLRLFGGRYGEITSEKMAVGNF